MLCLPKYFEWRFLLKIFIFIKDVPMKCNYFEYCNKNIKNLFEGFYGILPKMVEILIFLMITTYSNCLTTFELNSIKFWILVPTRFTNIHNVFVKIWIFSLSGILSIFCCHHIANSCLTVTFKIIFFSLSIFLIRILVDWFYSNFQLRSLKHCKITLKHLFPIRIYFIST